MNNSILIINLKIINLKNVMSLVLDKAFDLCNLCILDALRHLHLAVE